MKKLRNLKRSAKPLCKARNSETYKTQKKLIQKRFAGNSIKERLSKCPGVDIEDTDKEQPQAESKNINRQNEKSKTKEARDPARSRVQ